MSFFGRLIYNSINVDLARRWQSFQDTNINIGTNTVAASGVESNSTYYDLDMLEIFRKSLTAQEMIELRQWYEFVKGGASFELLRDRGLGTMISFEGKSLNDINEVGVTFTRTNVNDTASYLDPSTGLQTFVNVANTARFPAGKFGSGVLVEGTSDNICEESLDFTGTGWASSNVTVTDDTAETKDPFGNNNAAKCVTTSANGTVTYTTSTASSGKDITNSLFIKSSSGSVAGDIIVRDSVDGNLATVEFTATPVWQKVQVTDEGSNGIGNILLRFTIDPNTTILYVYGGQIEPDALFASNFIKTDGGAKTRNADLLLKATANVMDKDQGTVGFWFNPPWIHTDSPDSILWEVDDINGNSTMAIRATATGVYNIYRRINNSLTNLFNDSAQTASAITKNSWNNHIVLTWDKTASSHNLYFNGVLLKNYTHDAGNYSELSTNFSIGSGISGNLPSFCAFDDFFIRKDVLNLDQIKSIYNRGVGLAEQRNRWPSVKLVENSFNLVRKPGNNRYDWHGTFKEVIS